jgi:hypothetical protein
MAVGEGNENDVFLASLLDTCTARKYRCLAGTDHPPRVGQQNNLEQDFGMDGSCAGLVVIVSSFKDREIDMLVHQLADSMIQRTRDKLVLEGNREHDQLIFIAGFDFCHRFLYLIDKYTEP